MYCGVSKRLATPPTSIFHCLRLFHSSTRRSLSLMAVYIPSFQVLRGRPRFFLPSGFQLIIIFGSRVGSILSTWPHQMSCFPVISSNIVSCLFIFSLIYSFIFLSSLEILAFKNVIHRNPQALILTSHLRYSDVSTTVKNLVQLSRPILSRVEE